MVPHAFLLSPSVRWTQHPDHKTPPQQQQSPDGTAKDVRRVFAFKDALLLLDFADPSSDMMKAALLQCMISPAYLTVPEGMRFLSFLFCLSLEMVEALHATIKSTLPFCPKKYIEEYGNIYYRAWRSATNQYLDKIERHCIQDLMDRAVHARRDGGKGSMATTTRALLDAFHDKKSERGVDETLTRLYQPILWRALKAANPLVRANACSLLASAFPLRNPAEGRQENEELMQQQFDAFTAVLVDEFPVVRSTGVESVFRVACIYWELIPKSTLSGLLTKIMGNLASDASSSAVRVAVFKGITYLLGNPLSQPLLGKLLSKMGENIHDSAEKVRSAFLDVLVACVPIRGIKFWDIVPVDHLLARLEIDSAAVCKKIVGLLQSSYFPQNKSEATRIARCLQMASTQPRASRVFYQLLGEFVSESDVGKFVITIFDTVVDSLVNEDPMLDNDEAGIPRADIPALLDVAAVMMGSISALLQDADNKRFCKRLMESAAPLFDLVDEEFADDRQVQAAVTQIQCYVPAANKRSKAVLAQIEALDDNAAPTDFKPLVDCMCAWGRADQVLTQAHTWLHAAFYPEDTAASGKKKAKGKAAASKKASSAAKPRLALGCIDHVLCAVVKQQAKCSPAKLKSVIELLSGTRAEIDTRLDTPVEDHTASPSESHLRQAFELYIKGSIGTTIASPDAAPEQLLLDCQDLIVWAQESILPRIKAAGGEVAAEPARRSGRKRKVVAETPPETFSPHPYLSTVLTAQTELLKLGIHNEAFVNKVQGFCIELLQAASNVKYILGVGKVLSELIAISCSSGSTVNYDEYTNELLAEWLHAACASEEQLAAISATFALVAKGYQQRRMLSVLLGEVATLCVTLAEEDNDAGINYFVTYVSKTKPTLSAFLKGLPDSIERSEFTVRVLQEVQTVCAALASGDDDARVVAVRNCITETLRTFRFQHEAAVEAAKPTEEDIAAVEPLPAAVAPVVKETAAQKRAKVVKVSSIRVKLTEEKMKLEQHVEDEDFPAAALAKARIAELEAKKAELIGVPVPALVAEVAPAPVVEPEPVEIPFAIALLEQMIESN